MRKEKGVSACNVSMDQHFKDKREDHHLSSHKGPYGNCDAVLVWTCTKVWEAFRTVDNFLGNHKVPKCWHLIETIIQTYRMKCVAESSLPLLSLLISFHKPYRQQWQSWCKSSWGIFYHAKMLQMEIKCDLVGWLLPVALKRSSRYAQKEMKWTKILNMLHGNVYYFCYAVLQRAKVQKYFYKFTLFHVYNFTLTKLKNYLLLHFCISCVTLQ